MKLLIMNACLLASASFASAQQANPDAATLAKKHPPLYEVAPAIKLDATKVPVWRDRFTNLPPTIAVNMPCIRPNLNEVVPIPNAWAGKGPFINQMPNPAQPPIPAPSAK